MKKVILIITIGIMMMSLGSALEFDNVKSYNEITREVTITNAFGLGDEIGRARLNTPLNVKVGAGYQKVAEFDIWAYDDYSDALKQFTFEDMKKGREKINRDYDLRYLSYDNVEVDDYDYECYLDYSNSTNGTQVCNRINVGTHFENREVWKKITPANLKKNERLTIGVFTDVQAGDYVDWIPTIFGIEVKEWATWEADLGVSLVSYYKLDNNDLDDSLGNYNLTNGGTINSTGIIISGREFDGINDYMINSMTETFGTTASISWWMNWDDVGTGDVQVLFEAQSGSKMMVHTGTTTNAIRWTFNDDGTSMDNPNIISSGWHHYVVTYNGTHSKIYKDGILNNTEAHSYSSLSTTELNIGRRNTPAYFFDGKMDEIGVWNRALSEEEIGWLYSNSTGCSYGNNSCLPDGDNPPIITLNSPSSANYTSHQNVTINLTAYDSINLSDVKLYINDALNQTNASGINNTDYLFNITLTDGDYTIYGKATDNNSQETNSSSIRIVIDSINPTINLYEPTGTITNNGTIELNWTATDIHIDTCWYEYNNTNTTVTCSDNITYITPVAQYNITFYANDTLGNIASATNNFSWSIEVNGINSLGELISNLNVEIENISIDTNENPLIRSADTFLTGLETKIMLVNMTDTDGYTINTAENITFRANTSEYNITLTSKSLVLNFYHYNGSEATTTGFWIDENSGTGNFTNSSYVGIVGNFTEGTVKIRWAWNETIMNYTQFYEYENDWAVATIENITVLDNADVIQYISVIDESGNPLDDVLVKASMSKPSVGGEWQEIGQRFTGSEGTSGEASMYFDSDSIVKLRFTKDGWGAQDSKEIDMSFETYTRADPLEIVLTRSEFSVYQGVYMVFPKYYNLNMSTITFRTYAPSRETVRYTTNYRTAQGYSTNGITLDSHKYGCSNLTLNTDYGTALQDLVVSVWVDDVFWKNITIEYDANINTGKFNEPSSLNETTKLRIIWIGLIAIVAVLGLLIKRGDEEDGDGGMSKELFMGGIIIINLIFGIVFPMLLFVVVLWIAMLSLRKWFSE